MNLAILSDKQTAVTPFSFDDFAVRALTIGGEPWFVAQDVCEALGLENTSQAVKGRADRGNQDGLDSDEQGIATVTTPSGDQQMLVVNESGLYGLTFKSRKPEAKRFKRWVTSEVLPSIRKTGSYNAPTLDTEEGKLLMIQDMAAKQLALIHENKQQKQALAIAAPKADALDRIAGATGSLTIREAAKDLQVKPLTFSNWLRKHKWIYKQGRSNLAHQPRIDAGLMTHKVTLVEVEGEDGVTFEKPVTQARITPKGLAKLAVVFGEVAA